MNQGLVPAGFSAAISMASRRPNGGSISVRERDRVDVAAVVGLGAVG